MLLLPILGVNSVKMLKFDDKLLLFVVFMSFGESLNNLQQYGTSCAASFLNYGPDVLNSSVNIVT